MEKQQNRLNNALNEDENSSQFSDVNVEKPNKSNKVLNRFIIGALIAGMALIGTKTSLNFITEKAENVYSEVSGLLNQEPTSIVETQEIEDISNSIDNNLNTEQISYAFSKYASYEAFIAELSNRDLLNKFAAWERQALYNDGISMQYISALNEYNLLNKLAGHEIVSFAKSGIRPESLDKWDQLNLLDKVEGYNIIAFENSSYSFDQIKKFDDQGWLQKYDQYEIVTLDQSGIPNDVLIEYENAGVIKSSPIYEVIQFWNGGIPADFLKDLDDKGLLKKLDYSEVNDLYKRKASTM